jgi:hypothetical protein
MRLLEVLGADLRARDVCGDRQHGHSTAPQGIWIRWASRWASNRPLIRCRLPGPQLPAHTASCPVSAASAATANTAVSS